MRHFSRLSLTCAVIGSMVGGMTALPATGADKPLGMVLTSQAGYLNRTLAATGVDVYSGDALSTDPGGTLRWKVKWTQLYLLSASAATLAQSNAVLHAHLGSGTIGFSTAPGDGLEIETPVGTVRPAAGQRAYAQVTIVAPDTILVAAYRGSLVVNGHGEERTIKEGEAYNVRFVPDSAPAEPANSPPQKAYNSGNGHLIFALTFVGISAVISGIIYHQEAESDSAPQ
jgi:hypothetical protein